VDGRDRPHVPPRHHPDHARAPGPGRPRGPGSCTITFNNKGGYFSPRNPLSPLYGQIGRNTPVRVSAVGGTPWLNHPASGPARQRASTPDAAVLDIVGDLDVRFDVEPLDWNAAGIVELGGKYGAAGNGRGK
jgi:hypothetical protein